MRKVTCFTRRARQNKRRALLKSRGAKLGPNSTGGRPTDFGT